MRKVAETKARNPEESHLHIEIENICSKAQHLHHQSSQSHRGGSSTGQDREEDEVQQEMRRLDQLAHRSMTQLRFARYALACTRFPVMDTLQQRIEAFIAKGAEVSGLRSGAEEHFCRHVFPTMVTYQELHFRKEAVKQEVYDRFVVAQFLLQPPPSQPKPMPPGSNSGNKNLIIRFQSSYNDVCMQPRDAWIRYVAVDVDNSTGETTTKKEEEEEQTMLFGAHQRLSTEFGGRFVEDHDAFGGDLSVLMFADRWGTSLCDANWFEKNITWHSDALQQMVAVVPSFSILSEKTVWQLLVAAASAEAHRSAQEGWSASFSFPAPDIEAPFSPSVE